MAGKIATDQTDEMQLGKISGDYENLKTARITFVDMAVKSARFTIPNLFLNVDAEDDQEMHEEVYIHDSSVGASGINNLSATLLLAVFPSGTPFFRQDLTADSMQKLEQERGDEAKQFKTELDQSLRKIENQALELLEGGTARADLHEILRQFLLAQVLIYQNPKDNSLRAFKLNQHVNVRDGSGTVLRYITQEFVDPKNLSKKIQEEAHIPDEMLMMGKTDVTKLGLYTNIEKMSANKWVTIQELNGHLLKSTKQTFKTEDLPWYDIAFNRVTGAQYGSGFVEGILADLGSANGLRRSVVEGALIAVRTVFGVRPSSVTSADELLNTENGGFVRAERDDVFAIKVEKNADFQVALAAEAQVKADLNIAFMSKMAARRDAERVTAAEFQSIAEEIDSALGGTFSRLAVELQQRLAHNTLKFMVSKGMINKDTAKDFKTSIITGISALGRGNDRNRLNALLTDLGLAAQVPGLETMGQGLVPDELLLRMINAHTINATGLLKSEETKQGEADAAQQQQSAQVATETGVDLAKAAMAHPEGAQQLGDTMAQAMQGAPPPQQ